MRDLGLTLFYFYFLGFSVACELLRSDTTLEILDIGANNLTSQYACDILQVLYENRTLRSLGLGGNQIGEEGEQAIALLHTQNDRIDVAYDKAETPDENSP